MGKGILEYYHNRDNHTVRSCFIIRAGPFGSALLHVGLQRAPEKPIYFLNVKHNVEPWIHPKASFPGSLDSLGMIL